jgi:hypothetical protein
MAAATENTLSKVDSLVEENKDGSKPTKRRQSSMAADVYRIEDLGECSQLTMAQVRGYAGQR